MPPTFGIFAEFGMKLAPKTQIRRDASLTSECLKMRLLYGEFAREAENVWCHRDKKET